MTTRREQILDQIEVNLLTVATMKEVKVNKSDPLDMETAVLPCSWVFSGSDTRVSGVVGYENWQWEVFIEVWAQDTNMEELLGAIHQAMFAGRNMNGLADNSYRTGCQMFAVDPEHSIEGMLLTYKVEFKHPLGIM